jgi:hypothetical protein
VGHEDSDDEVREPGSFLLLPARALPQGSHRQCRRNDATELCSC